VVVSGALDEYYSLNGGDDFNVSIGGGQAQCLRTLMNNGKEVGFVAAGDFGLLSPKSGVAVSTDGGITFSAHSADLKTDARYVAAPSPTTFFLTAGTWPGEGNDDQKSNDDNFGNDDNFEGAKGTVERTARLSVVNGMPRVSLEDKFRAEGNFTAEVSSSTDGGKTWTQLFWEEGTFYPNGIACWDETHCCFVGEADQGAEPGTRIHCTTDGKTFTRTFYQAGGQYSMLDISIVPGSTGEGWAVGGILTDSPEATFYHTTNFGASWTLNSTISGSYAAAIDCVDAGHCWAPTLQPLFQTAGVAAIV